MDIRATYPGLPGFGYVPLATDPDVRVPPAWTVEATDPDLPTLRIGLVVRDGHARVESVTLTARDDGREVTADDLRRVRLADWTEASVEAVAMHVVPRDDDTEETRIPSGSDTAARTRAVKAYRASRAPTRRSPVTDERLREVAAVYTAHRDRYPTKAVEEALGLRSRRTAQLWVKRAEDAGFLTRTTQPTEEETALVWLAARGGVWHLGGDGRAYCGRRLGGAVQRHEGDKPPGKACRACVRRYEPTTREDGR